MATFHQRLSELIETYKEMQNAAFTITIEKSIDPTKKPGNGWKNAISAQVAAQYAQKEILIVVGPTTNGYYYK